MSIGTRIIQARNQRNMSQRELSERSGIACSYLSRIENRRLEPRPKTLRRIAEALGVSVGEFFRDERASATLSRCAITVSGECVMDLLRSRRRKGQRSGTDAFSPRQLQLLRMSGYLIQTGNSRLLDALDTLLSALLVSEAQRGPVMKATLSSGPQSPAAVRFGSKLMC
jgi:transcriptional regulator with XRE-family HTH domain